MWQPIETAPKDETWILLYGDWNGEPRVNLGFWGGYTDDDKDWSDSECASHPLTAFGWQPTHWAPFEPPEVMGKQE